MTVLSLCVDNDDALDSPLLATRPYNLRGPTPVNDVGRLLLQCADRPGLVAAVGTFLARSGANVLSLDQHATEELGGMFMQRTIFYLPGLGAARDDLERDFREQVAEKFGAEFRLTEASKPKKIAIFASKTDHCLLDLLWRNRRGELYTSVVMVISNHPDLADQVRPFGVPFIYIPPEKTSESKPKAVSSNCFAVTSIW